MRLANIPLDPAIPSKFTAAPGINARAVVEDKDGLDIGPDAELGPWTEGKVFVEARTAVWTETGAGVRTGASGKVFAEHGVVKGTGAWAEAGWRPVDTDEGDLPSMPRGPAAWLGQARLQTGGEVEREQAAFSSVLTMLAETAELQAPPVGKPLGLMSKAAWSKSLSSSSSKASFTSTTKALSFPSPSSSSSSSYSASKNDSQTAEASNTSLIVGNNNSSINSSLGMYSSSCKTAFMSYDGINCSQNSPSTDNL